MLVSLRRIEELCGIHPDEQGGLRIGAMATHREVAAEERLVGCNDVVREAAASIDVTIRNMGTIGGAISHADPASDLNTALVAAGARAEIAANRRISNKFSPPGIKTIDPIRVARFAKPLIVM